MNPLTTSPLIPLHLNANTRAQNRANHRLGRLLSGRAVAGKGLTGAWNQEAIEKLQYQPD